MPNARVPTTLASPAAWICATVGELTSKATGRPPRLSFGELHFLGAELTPDARRALHQLDRRPSDTAAAVATTLRAFGVRTA
ncbi:hypothetical protein OG689_10315 [Kitasatospora sp. NBC_00240]|uniref:hypothetical protein n=1 Tax=Kitasatospora sp. NBC_00240 TaxID=2903567 RepID=UPI002255A42A|nr:hypothetical protein [Kitasatospora sp. NBC_00240]MCX5209677.1 hypothetical protein [Kitasatospora sp. NBC_00240]